MYISWFIFEIFDLNKCTSIEFYIIHPYAIMFMHSVDERACDENDELGNEFYLVEIWSNTMTTAH